MSFELSQPIEVELLRQDPPVGGKFPWTLVDIHLRGVRFEHAVEIGLFLDVAPVLPRLLQAHLFGIEVAITGAPADHPVMMGLQTDLLPHFAEQSLLLSLAWIHPSLGKLPRTRDGR